MLIFTKIVVDVSALLIFLYFFYTFFLFLLPTNKRVMSVEYTEFEYYFLIPCLNEEEVIKSTIQGIQSLPYRKIKIIVIDDASSDRTAEIVTSLITSDQIEIIKRKKPHAQLGKGEALNEAFQYLKKQIISMKKDPNQIILSVIDGDGKPSQNIIRKANEAFSDERVGAAQTRIKISNNQSVFPLLQDIEFYATVAAIQNSREYAESVCLGGNGQFTRFSALMDIGKKPWSKCLLEDFDLGLSILLAGWETRFIGDAIVYQQGLVSIKKFIKQRSRWVQGNLQSWKRLTEIIQTKHLPITAKVDLFYFLLQPWINLLASFICIASWLLITWLVIQLDLNSFTIFSQKGFVYNVLPLLFLLFLVIFPGLIWTMDYYYRCKKEKEHLSIITCIKAVLASPLYTLLTLPSVWLAMERFILNKDSWIKTERVTEEVRSSEDERESV